MIPKKYGLWLLLLWVLGVAVAPLAAATDIYDEKADARLDIGAGIRTAEASKKNVVLIFGANW